MLKFLGRGSAFSDEHNSAFFIENNELVLIDCPATSYQKVKKMNWKQYDNIYRASLKTRLIKEKTDRCGSCKESFRRRVFALQGRLTQKMTCIAVFSQKGFLEMPYSLEELQSMEVGSCIIKGFLWSKTERKHKFAILKGKNDNT